MQTRMQVGRSTEDCGEIFDMEPNVYKRRLVNVLMALSEAEDGKIDIYFIEEESGRSQFQR